MGKKTLCISLLILVLISSLSTYGQTSVYPKKAYIPVLIDTPIVKKRVFEGYVLDANQKGIGLVKGYVIGSNEVFFTTDRDGFFSLNTYNDKDTAFVQLIKTGYKPKKVLLVQQHKSKINLIKEDTYSDKVLFSGLILDEDNAGIPLARIYLKENPKIFTKSDFNGRFQFYLENGKGKKNILVEKKGYETYKGNLKYKERQENYIRLSRIHYDVNLKKNYDLKGALYTSNNKPVINYEFWINAQKYRTNTSGQFELKGYVEGEKLNFKFDDNYNMVKYSFADDHKYVYVYLKKIPQPIVANDTIKTISELKKAKNKKEKLSQIIRDFKKKNEDFIKQKKKFHLQLSLLNRKLKDTESLSLTEKNNLKKEILSLAKIIEQNEKQYEALSENTRKKISEMKKTLFKKDSLYLASKQTVEKEKKEKESIKKDYRNNILRFLVIILASLVIIFLFIMLRRKYKIQKQTLIEQQKIIEKQNKEIKQYREEIEALQVKPKSTN